ncbi:alanyl-tRNA editing protein [Candidatus Pacearchaeota archaeon]|nr:alanyl-tRNA editing protein [Candidatus Pacearchaeota archaeon]
MIELLYLKDSYVKEYNAKITEVIINNDKCFIVLDKTIFYPQGGGQIYDTGKIIDEKGEEYQVISVRKVDGKILHEINKPGLIQNQKIKGIIDWERRYKLMRSHTATHILAETIFKETNALITGNNIDLDKCRIDFDLESNDPEMMKKAVEDANKVIAQNLPIKIEFMSREEAFKIPQLSKLAKGLPENLKEIRVVSIGDYDIQGDGGTHVHNTSEIGKIEFITTDNRGKNNRRIYFKIID